MEFGQIPKQLFDSRHVERNQFLRQYNDVDLVQKVQRILTSSPEEVEDEIGNEIIKKKY